MYVRPPLRKILDYTSIWFENHEVQEEDGDKAKALKTFVDWLERNVDEMIEISNTEDYENVLNCITFCDGSQKMRQAICL